MSCWLFHDWCVVDSAYRFVGNWVVTTVDDELLTLCSAEFRFCPTDKICRRCGTVSLGLQKAILKVKQREQRKAERKALEQAKRQQQRERDRPLEARVGKYKELFWKANGGE